VVGAGSCRNADPVQLLPGRVIHLQTRQYIIIGFLSDLLPLAVQKVLYILAQVLAACFAAILAKLTWDFAPTLLGTRSATLGLSGIWTGIPIGFAAAMIVMTSLYYLAYGLWAFRRPDAGRSLLEIETHGLVLSPLDAIE
jgi:TRAP-type C4-dicarboxylate transport system permease small subunit